MIVSMVVSRYHMLLIRPLGAQDRGSSMQILNSYAIIIA